MAARLGATVGPLAVALGLAACGGASADDPSTSKAKAATESASPAKEATAGPTPVGKPGVQIKARQSDYGKIIVTGSGITLYLFEKEKQAKSECYGACATAWPPVPARGRPIAGAGVKQELLGTTTRSNGRKQVTYGGHPLYLYAPEGPGEILCQDVFEYGGLWLIVRPSGKPVR